MTIDDSIDDKLGNAGVVSQLHKDVTRSYVAKGIAKYLKVNPAPLNLDAFPSDPEMDELDREYTLKKHGVIPKTESDLRAEELVSELIAGTRREDQRKGEAGVVTQVQLDAWTVAHEAGQSLFDHVAEYGQNGLMRVSSGVFEEFLGKSVDKGIRKLEFVYEMPDQGTEWQTINEEFRDDAVRWIAEQVYSRKGTECNLLSRVSVQQENNEYVTIKMDWRPDLI